MYSRGFVAGILAGFERAIDALMNGVEGRVRTELEELGTCIAETRLRVDREGGDDTETGPTGG